mmetsp:Transcript_17349/g.40269  ORF Transcript_17349/g.40269 Transcript_17349/m.40269 type:complete len:96 (+) Transcript_17349:1080-1367(+)
MQNTQPFLNLWMNQKDMSMQKQEQLGKGKMLLLERSLHYDTETSVIARVYKTKEVLIKRKVKHPHTCPNEMAFSPLRFFLVCPKQNTSQHVVILL